MSSKHSTSNPYIGHNNHKLNIQRVVESLPPSLRHGLLVVPPLIRAFEVVEPQREDLVVEPLLRGGSDGGFVVPRDLPRHRHLRLDHLTQFPVKRHDCGSETFSKLNTAI